MCIACVDCHVKGLNYAAIAKTAKPRAFKSAKTSYYETHKISKTENLFISSLRHTASLEFLHDDRRPISENSPTLTFIYYNLVFLPSFFYLFNLNRNARTHFTKPKKEIIKRFQTQGGGHIQGHTHKIGERGVILVLVIRAKTFPFTLFNLASRYQSL